MNKLKKFVPPILLDFKNKLFPSKYGWFGDYSSWQEAQKDCVGYHDEEIILKVKDAVLKVKNGEAVFERDSVIFDTVEYSWPTLAALNWIAAQNSGILKIIDFGGSLGSSYYQNRKFLRQLSSVEWNIIEQKQFVEVGQQLFQDNELRFYEDIAACYTNTLPQAVLFSSVLQYLEEPYKLLAQFFERNIEYIVVDLTGFTPNNEASKITVQRVNPAIYKASYPSWIFNKKEFLAVFAANSYELIENFKSDITLSYQGKIINYQGFIFRRKPVL
ncbi:TIGR04325 family methyltransferase [Pontibacter chinhatensis]|uniref:Putative methyltransferase, LIC12133 family n=1 Tax=Pontibacter chinhatensis TaxID=1436961 RepID=A0A1I2MTZ0_9BACT|nr:TIGR04325 family methyltransferase [Pontibacter chinhatensis]SFF94360.1 putative methyltransferase, LIC12133 family [Pontibacter chinhatensis]